MSLVKSMNWQTSTRVALLFFVVSLVIRVIGIGWGLPSSQNIASFHPDEPVNWAVTQQVDPLKGDLDPGFYNYGTAFFTINHLVNDVVDALGMGATDPSVATVGQQANEIAAGRFISAVCGSILVSITFLILFGRVHLIGACFGAGAVMVAPGLVMHSKFMTPDVMAAMFVTLSLYSGILASESPAMKHWVWAGIWAGLAAGTKYNGILALAGLLPALIAIQRSEIPKRFGIALGCALLTFVVSTPGVFVNTAQFSKDFSYELWHTSAGHGLVFAGTSPGYVAHLANIAVAFGTLLLLLSVCGTVLAIRDRLKWMSGLLAFALLYYLLIGKAELKFVRYVFPLLPVLAVLVGAIVAKAHTAANTKWRGVVAIAILGTFGVFGGGVMDTTRATMLMNEKDIRITIADQLKSNGRGKSVGLVADPWFYTPAFFPESSAPRYVPFKFREEARLSAQNPSVLRFVPPNPDERIDWDVRLLTEYKPDTIVFSSFETEGYERLAVQTPDDPRVASFLDFTKRLKEQYDLEKVYTSPIPPLHDMMYVRPTYYLWTRKNNSSNP